MPHRHQILVIFMIYAILSQNFAVRMYALFPQISLDWKTEFRRRYPFLDVWTYPTLPHKGQVNLFLFRIIWTMFFAPHHSWFGSGQFTVNLRCCKKLTSFSRLLAKGWLFQYWRCNAVLWGFKNRATQIGCVFELIGPNFCGHGLIKIWFSTMSPILPRYHRLVCCEIRMWTFLVFKVLQSCSGKLGQC